MEISMLEKQLEDAVSAKFDALARLDAAGGKKLSNLPHSLTNNRTEVMDQRSNQRRKRNQTENGERHGPHELQERSDNSAMDQSSDSASIQDELLSAVRLRRQSESTLDRYVNEWKFAGKILFYFILAGIPADGRMKTSFKVRPQKMLKR